MDEEQKIVAQKIESGDYFNEGFSWFHSKFTGPRTEFSYVLIICLLTLISLIIGIMTFAEIFPLAPGANFYMSRPVVAGEHITIKPIEGDKTKPNIALLTFLTSEYVKAHEEYIADHVQRNEEFIKSFSDEKTYQDYIGSISSSNPQSPLVIYGDQAVKEITIKRIRLLDSNGKDANETTATRALIDFQVSLIFLTQNTQEISNHQADISFQHKQITVDQKSGVINQKPELVITGYTTKILDNSK